ncbi:MAG: hypothetical protein MMC33_006524 [Icmadophila ericetorum]|nr:hypothetical protein [Icmadophila ericetorum]
MSTRGKVPDAWDDDWVSKADQPSTAGDSPQTEVKLSKAERRAKQAELNKKLWEEAEAPKNPYLFAPNDGVPLKSEFKPSVKVLSRKPAPKVAAGLDSSTGLGNLTLEDDDDDDEDNATKNTMTLEERKTKAQKEREEKQKKYEEVRQRLFGSSEASTSGSRSGNTTPPTSRTPGESRNRGKNKGGRDTSSRPQSSGDGKARQLYDPNYTEKPDSVYIQKKENQSLASASGTATPVDESIIRLPKGPDGSGRGGFGFANRGRGK